MHGPISQGYFLTRLGIRERTRNAAKANPDRAEEIAAAMRKLTMPEEMGARFRAGDLPVPAGADAPPGF